MMMSATLWTFVAVLLPALDPLVELVDRLVLTLLRLGALVIVLLAVDEHDDVGVLLDRAGFAQVGELRPLVLALLDGARELRERQDRHVSSLAIAFRPRVISESSCTRFSLRLRADRADQLQIVDDDEAEAVLALQPPRARAQRRHRASRACRR